MNWPQVTPRAPLTALPKSCPPAAPAAQRAKTCASQCKKKKKARCSLSVRYAALDAPKDDDLIIEGAAQKVVVDTFAGPSLPMLSSTSPKN